MEVQCIDKSYFKAFISCSCRTFDYQVFKKRFTKEMWTFLDLSAYTDISISKLKLILNGYITPACHDVLAIEFAMSFDAPQKKLSRALNTVITPLWQLEQDTGVDRRTIKRLMDGKPIHVKAYDKLAKGIVEA